MKVTKGVGKIFFISKKDALYSVGIWGTIAVVFFSVFPATFILSISDFVGLVIGIIVIACLIWAWFSIGYLIENNTLKIQVGPIEQKIDIKEIKNITKEKSVWSAAALSMDRVVIQYGNYGYAHVSPKKEYEFIKLVLSKNPQIQIDDALSKLYKI